MVKFDSRQIFGFPAVVFDMTQAVKLLQLPLYGMINVWTVNS